MDATEFVSNRTDCFFLATRPQVAEMEVCPAGNYAIDNVVLGIGGFACGRIHEVFGPESSGKTTLALHTMAYCHQVLDVDVLFVDAEHSLDLDYAASLGVDTDRLVISQPDYGEQALELVREAALSGAFKLIVVDSVAALVPKAELDGEIIDQQVGVHSRLMSKTLRMVVGAVSQSKTCVLFLNQEREKIGSGGYGPAKTTTGGNALKFYASTRVDVTNIGQIKEGETRVGHNVKVVAVKNKLYPPFKSAVVELRYGIGYDQASTLLDQGLTYTDLVKKEGNWWVIGDDKYNGRNAASAAIRGDEALRLGLVEALDAYYSGEAS